MFKQLTQEERETFIGIPLEETPEVISPHQNLTSGGWAIGVYSWGEKLVFRYIHPHVKDRYFFIDSRVVNAIEKARIAGIDVVLDYVESHIPNPDIA